MQHFATIQFNWLLFGISLLNCLLFGIPLLALLLVYLTKESRSYLYQIDELPVDADKLADSKKRFKAIYSFSSIALGASLALAYFFLGFHTEVLVAYDKTFSDKNVYDWFLPSDIIRFPIDQWRNLDPLTAPQIEERKIDDRSTKKSQCHLIIVDLTSSTYNKSQYSTDLAEEISAHFSQIENCQLDSLEGDKYDIREKLPLVFMDILRNTSDSAAIYFYNGNQNMTCVKWDNSNEIFYKCGTINLCKNQTHISNYFTTLNSAKEWCNKNPQHLTDFKKLITEINKILKDKRTGTPDSVAVTIISDFMHDIDLKKVKMNNGLHELGAVIEDWEKLKNCGSLNLIKTPVNKSEYTQKQVDSITQFVSLKMDSMFKKDRSSELRSIGDAKSKEVNNLHSIKTLVEAKIDDESNSCISFYYPKSFYRHKNAARGHFIFTDINEIEEVIFKLKASKDLSDVCLKLEVDEKLSEELKLGSEKSIFLKKGKSIKAYISPMNYPFEPDLELEVTSKTIKKTFILDFKPILSSSSSFYLFIWYNISLVSFFIIGYFFIYSINHVYDTPYISVNQVWFILLPYILIFLIELGYIVYILKGMCFGFLFSFIIIHCLFWYIGYNKLGFSNWKDLFKKKSPNTQHPIVASHI